MILLLFNQPASSGGASGTAFRSFVEADMFLGNWDVDDYLTFTACTHDDTGAAADADAVPSYAIYEDETAAAIVSGNMAKLGAVTGFYTERLQLTAASGFEAGKMYAVRVEAVMGGVTAAAAHSFAVKVASVNVTLWKDATAPAMTGDAYAVVTNATYGLDKLARTGADGDTLETLSDQLDAIDVNGTAAAVWAYTPRTLTQTAAAVASVMAGTSLTITRGDTLSATLTGLGNITGYANLWFTVKWATSDLDAAAIIQIDTDTGLLTVNGAAATAGNGSITVDDATAGDITIALEASVTDDLTPATGLVYDVQWQSGTSIYTLTSGVAVVSADVTRAVA